MSTLPLRLLWLASMASACWLFGLGPVDTGLATLAAGALALREQPQWTETAIAAGALALLIGGAL